MTPHRRGASASMAVALSMVMALAPVAAQELVLPADQAGPSASSAGMRSGREIYTRFRDGLADTTCEPGVSSRWRAHFANAPGRLAAKSDDVLPLFGYVVDALREANLPTEYALIPFVESGYKPGARSASGPAGLWQMIAITARNHGIAIRPGYDGRLSPVDSTQAAVRYLKTLHGMFAGDWRLAVMAYNAGEYRVFGALKRSGQRSNAARPAELVGLSGITQAYVRKLHALSCLLDQADDRDEWLRSLDRPVPVLTAVALPSGTASLDAWSDRQGFDAGLVRRMNPAFPDGRIASTVGTRRILVPGGLAPATQAMGAVTTTPAPLAATLPSASVPATSPQATKTNTSSTDGADPTSVSTDIARSHTVARGESVWIIARRYGLTSAQLLERNGLNARSVLQPGMVLTLAANTAP